MTLPASGPLAFTDIQTEFGGTNPIGLNEYYAGGGLVPAGTSGTYGAVPTSGQLSVQNFYGTSNYIPVYIEELFSTYLYTGNGGTQTITNGINLSGNGGLVWIKNRLVTGGYHNLWDTARGNAYLISNDTAASQTLPSGGLTSFGTTGFEVTQYSTSDWFNKTSDSYVSWTFREQPKFFDVVTYTGTGSARTVAHNLGSVPGFIVVKRVTSAGGWWVYHRSLGATKYMALNTTDPVETASSVWNDTEPTSSVFTVGSFSEVNQSGQTFVAYIFAHNAGGFGLTGSDNVISCGSFTTNGSGGVTVDLGYEPQWLFLKNVTAGYDSVLVDNMRGFPASGDAKSLRPETDTQEGNRYVYTNSTGFSSPNNLGPSLEWIYIAIRRGPMKVPTSGTSVFSPISITPSSGTVSTTNFPVDLMITTEKTTGGTSRIVHDKLRGVGTVGASNARTLITNGVNAEFAGSSVTYDWWNTGFTWGAGFAGEPMVAWNFKRAPSFFDEVCYTGNGTAGTTITHNLGVAPEFIQVKCRSNANGWYGYTSTTGNTKTINWADVDSAQVDSTAWNNTSPTSSVFTVGTSNSVNGSARTYVAYLFATCAGVSKVGSYTGTGALLTVNCGFTSGARFVLIKRTDSTGNWWTYDSARGITSGNDPYLFLDDTSAEVTGTNYVDTTSVGFQVTAAAPAGLNASGGTYIFLAIA